MYRYRIESIDYLIEIYPVYNCTMYILGWKPVDGWKIEFKDIKKKKVFQFLFSRSLRNLLRYGTGSLLKIHVTKSTEKWRENKFFDAIYCMQKFSTAIFL